VAQVYFFCLTLKREFFTSFASDLTLDRFLFFLFSFNQQGGLSRKE